MKKLITIIFMTLVMSMGVAISAETEQKIPENLAKDKSLLVQCFSYSTPGTINGPMGELTVAGLLPGNPRLTVTLTILFGNPITATLNGTGKRTANGVTGKIEGALHQLGEPQKWIKSKLTAIFPAGTAKGTLTMTGIGTNLELSNGCVNK